MLDFTSRLKEYWHSLKSYFTRETINMEFTEYFMEKVSKPQKHYSSPPKIDEQLKTFENILDYLTFEDIELLVHSYKQKHQFHSAYDLTNVKVIEDYGDFRNLKSYFVEVGNLKPGESIKLILKIKKGEPAHYAPYLGVHMLCVYIRNEGQHLSAFIFDAAAGLLCDKRDGFDHLTETLEAYLALQRSPNYRIIKSSAIIMGDQRNCPIYSLAAMRYFIKHGYQFFSQIEPFLLAQSDKIFDKENNKVFHLKADGLPAHLVKLTNRRTLTRVNQAYQHEWMPIKLALTEAYAANEDLIAHLSLQEVAKHKETMLQSYLEHHGEERTSSKGSYRFNLVPDRKMAKARRDVLWLLSLNSIYSSNTEDSSPNRSQLEKMFRRVRQ